MATLQQRQIFLHATHSFVHPAYSEHNPPSISPMSCNLDALLSLACEGGRALQPFQSTYSSHEHQEEHLKRSHHASCTQLPKIHTA
jgi:hypothetical protein